MNENKILSDVLSQFGIFLAYFLFLVFKDYIQRKKSKKIMVVRPTKANNHYHVRRSKKRFN